MPEGIHFRQGNEEIRKRSVTVIIENSKGEILLMLRDDKPDIPFPNQWYIPGGSMEESDATPLDALRREIREEMGLDLHEVSPFSTYEWEEKEEHVFCARLDIDTSAVSLTEGQEIKYFSSDEIDKMRLAFHDSQIAEDFFATRNHL